MRAETVAETTDKETMATTGSVANPMKGRGGQAG